MLYKACTLHWIFAATGAENSCRQEFDGCSTSFLFLAQVKYQIQFPAAPMRMHDCEEEPMFDTAILKKTSAFVRKIQIIKSTKWPREALK